MQMLTSILSYPSSYSSFLTRLNKSYAPSINMFFMLLALLLTSSVFTSFTARAAETARATNTAQKSSAPQAALKMAPSWSLLDAKGNLVSSKDFAGKPLIIHFWATWCPYCKKLQPGLDRLFKKYQAQGLQMIAISLLEEEGANPQEALTARGMSFKTLVDGDSIAMEKFFVRGTPTTFFINAKGQFVVATRLSDPNDPRLEQVVKSLMVN
ncbi:Thiol-disulfide oxidoreductase ResA [Paraglaciecola mesophila]|uniref:Thiol-disulfide oxidoreductase ResA n=2 Tax=Paraglaciecola mesophila TaxID=197222 RepID=A0A857JH04_9ALTE|nr:Thiol-disulfide oxidoreductase ResA [Paraglaciecola mesophila]